MLHGHHQSLKAKAINTAIAHEIQHHETIMCDSNIKMELSEEQHINKHVGQSANKESKTQTEIETANQKIDTALKCRGQNQRKTSWWYIENILRSQKTKPVTT